MGGIFRIRSPWYGHYILVSPSLTTAPGKEPARSLADRSRSPGLEDLWQLHYAAESDRDHNIADERIANVKENCEGKYLKVTAEADGTLHTDQQTNR